MVLGDDAGIEAGKPGERGNHVIVLLDAGGEMDEIGGPGIVFRLAHGIQGRPRSVAHSIAAAASEGSAKLGGRIA